MARGGLGGGHRAGGASPARRRVAERLRLARAATTDRGAALAAGRHRRDACRLSPLRCRAGRDRGSRSAHERLAEHSTRTRGCCSAPRDAVAFRGRYCPRRHGDRARASRTAVLTATPPTRRADARPVAPADDGSSRLPPIPRARRRPGSGDHLSSRAGIPRRGGRHPLAVHSRSRTRGRGVDHRRRAGSPRPGTGVVGVRRRISASAADAAAHTGASCLGLPCRIAVVDPGEASILERLRRRRLFPLQRRLPADTGVRVLVHELDRHVVPPLLRARRGIDLTHRTGGGADRRRPVPARPGVAAAELDRTHVQPRPLLPDATRGHFAPHEEPALLADDIAAFARALPHASPA